MVMSCVCLLILMLPMLVVALLVRVKLGSPVLFKQQRTGLHGQLFTIIKFRTMAVAQVEDEADAHRIDRFGALLRKLSLDELPQLWNVLKGELSFVGPRPLLPEYLPLYSAEQARRHEVKPGITGWAQVNGRNALSWPEKFVLDVYYVDHCQFGFDLQILLKTLIKVFCTQQVNQPGSVSADKFTGNDVDLTLNNNRSPSLTPLGRGPHAHDLDAQRQCPSDRGEGIVNANKQDALYE